MNVSILGQYKLKMLIPVITNQPYPLSVGDPHTTSKGTRVLECAAAKVT